MDITNPPDVALDLGNQGMHPGEQMHRRFTRACHHRFMAMWHLCQHPVGLPAIGAHRRCRQQILLRPAFEVVAAYLGHLPQRGETALIARSFCGHHHFRLAAGSTAPFAWFGRPQVSVIHLQQPGDEKDFLGGELGVPGIVRCSPGPSRQSSLWVD